MFPLSYRCESLLFGALDSWAICRSSRAPLRSRTYVEELLSTQKYILYNFTPLRPPTENTLFPSFNFRLKRTSVAPATEASSMSKFGCVCDHCGDISDLISPYNGTTLFAKTSRGEIIVALHTRCEQAWADKHSCRTLVPLKKMRHSYQFVSSVH